VLKTAVEVGTNKNVYYDTPIAAQEGATVKAPAYMNFLAEDTPNGKRVDAKLRHIFKNLFPSLEQASNAVSVAKGEVSVSNEEKASGWLTGLRTYTVDTKKAKDQAISDYIKKLEELEAKAKSEGYVSKTAKQIKDAKDREEQYQTIKDIYEAEYQKRQAIYQNNYVIKKKK
jgi:putative lipase involved disintegration of autophagic bodies